MLESIIIKHDTSHKEDGNKVILTDYEVDDDQKVKSYSSFYIKNSDDQFIEYKKIGEKYEQTNIYVNYTYSSNQLLDQVNENYIIKEYTGEHKAKFKYKNRRYIKNLDKYVIKKIIQMNSFGEKSIWWYVNIVKQ